jgi:hypothetical protein
VEIESASSLTQAKASAIANTFSVVAVRIGAPL